MREPSPAAVVLRGLLTLKSERRYQRDGLPEPKSLDPLIALFSSSDVWPQLAATVDMVGAEREAGQAMDRLLTYGETADRLGIATRTVRRMVADGRLPAVRLSARTVRVRESDLAEVLNAAA